MAAIRAHVPSEDPLADPRRSQPMMADMDIVDLDRAEVELSSLLHKCEAVVRGSTLSPSRQTLMTNRVAALQTALELVAEAKSHRAT